MEWRRLFEGTLVMRLGGAIAAIALLAVLGMAVSGMVALTTQGSGEAINLTGSLRMQGWQMASLYLSRTAGDGEENRRRLAAAVEEFDATLIAPPILSMLPGRGETRLAESYEVVREAWQGRFRPRFLAAVTELDPTPPDTADTTALLRDVRVFVKDISHLVKQMELATEAKITVMQLVLGVGLTLTVMMVILTIQLIHTGLVTPLRDLLAFAATVGQGELTVRTDYTGNDELGRLGSAFNLMAEDLQKLYQDLEARVEQKTAELTRSNRSLELLYHSIARLHGAPPGAEAYQAVLRDVQSLLGLGRGILCLGEPGGSAGQPMAITMAPGDANPCQRGDCSWCHGTLKLRASTMGDGRQLITLPLSDAERQYGVLMVDMPPGQHPESWQVQLLEALSRHIGVAIGAERRIEQSRRLALLDERAVIARELHDSLAQSLAYMKIQVSRLQGALRDPARAAETGPMLAELREGLSGAYRQLRELLSTFRLNMEGADLQRALEQTVEEFSGRSGLSIDLDMDLGACQLSPNEEIHLLHVVREALSNVVHHAQASRARVAIGGDGEGIVHAAVEDDGSGIIRKNADVHHYGMTIMEERARTLHGEIHYRERPGGGTRVVLSFRPAGPCFPRAKRPHDHD